MPFYLVNSVREIKDCAGKGFVCRQSWPCQGGIELCGSDAVKFFPEIQFPMCEAGDAAHVAVAQERLDAYFLWRRSQEIRNTVIGACTACGRRLAIHSTTLCCVECRAGRAIGEGESGWLCSTKCADRHHAEKHSDSPPVPLYGTCPSCGAKVLRPPTAGPGGEAYCSLACAERGIVGRP